MRILLAGGGTGGHLYPALSLARALSGAPADPGRCKPGETIPQIELQLDLETREGAPSILLVSSHAELDAGVLAETRIATARVASGPISRSSLIAAAGGLAANSVGVMQALPIVARFKPDVVIATGGYASVPVVAAAATLRTARRLPKVKIAIVEPNAMPGLANRTLAKVADEVWGTYAETGPYFPGKFVRIGTPIRPEFYAPPPKADARRRLNLDPDRRTLLVFGGSQGSRRINVAVSAMAARRRLPTDWQVLHVAGKRDFEWMAAERRSEPNDNRYVVLPYLDDMALGFAAADAIVSRAGASTLAEIAISGIASILVPYPHAAEDHQTKNAAAFVSRGAALVIADERLDADALYWALVELLDDDKRETMAAAARGLSQPRALHHMVERILTGGIGSR
ncbi:MAG TPA: UDP-N-acetylglucosamine--N-acetylmuramyl-(pentapeptide) pyrophosphoryl-undecaprenol N-acetylglucosamine transferase [Candidatus Eremiobacteraceae bacterium]|nr:UDP-N-acetylglucosamine--N-acetylmuramyl-(pentapeptide) pyrophosphoryl-undecaprenol N-acetylglucosamine transferase [Candidatus Eremiobacteraceae bacterium]